MESSLDVTAETPLMSCVMPTYGRPDYVPEAVACFLEQDYPNKELIVLNDCEGQVYEGELPGVRIVNREQRYPTLGDKRNACIEFANGELIAVWDDDDLSLPWRLSFSWSEMKRLGTPFYRPAEFLAYWGEARLHGNQSVPGWVSHGAVCFTKELWAAVGGYPSQGLGEDATFFKCIHEHLGKEFISYPLTHSDRFYILRGKSAYQHMSIDGGDGPLNCSPGRFTILPHPIQDDVLRTATEQVKNSRGIHAPEIARIESCAGTEPILSVCIAVKNRSRLHHEHRLLDPLPRTVRSLSDAAREIGHLELVITDFGSTDWPLSEWLHSAGNLSVKLVNVKEDFSRGRGLNLAAKHAASERLFLTDADVLVDSEALLRGLSSLEQGIVRFPVFRCLDVNGHAGHFEDLTKGLVFLARQQLFESGGVPEFKSWGGEDDILLEAIQAVFPVERVRDNGLKHQWHPESARHENYVNPRHSDYRKLLAAKQTDHEHRKLFVVLDIEHEEWCGPVNQINLYKDGFMERPGLDRGSYELVPEKQLTLNWDDWPIETLHWEATAQVYRHRSKSFTARVREEPVVTRV